MVLKLTSGHVRRWHIYNSSSNFFDANDDTLKSKHHRIDLCCSSSVTFERHACLFPRYAAMHRNPSSRSFFFCFLRCFLFRTFSLFVPPTSYLYVLISVELSNILRAFLNSPPTQNGQSKCALLTFPQAEHLFNAVTSFNPLPAINR